MVIVKGAYTDLFGYFRDECSPLRHFFANLRLCKHKGKWIGLKEAFYEDLYKHPFS